jgi:hypothetical protein
MQQKTRRQEKKNKVCKFDWSLCCSFHCLSASYVDSSHLWGRRSNLHNFQLQSDIKRRVQLLQENNATVTVLFLIWQLHYRSIIAKIYLHIINKLCTLRHQRRVHTYIWSSIKVHILTNIYVGTVSLRRYIITTTFEYFTCCKNLLHAYIGTYVAVVQYSLYQKGIPS